jgi:5-(carboxyamino)imidazole ribonucleotide mutase
MDALLSVAQMPKPIPVATVGVDNAANAGYLAVEILSLKYPDLRKKLAAFREKMKADFAGENSRDPFMGYSTITTAKIQGL